MNVEISAGHRVDLVNFTLSGLTVSNRKVKTEGKVVFKPDSSTLNFERDLEVVPGESEFKVEIATSLLRYLGIVQI